MSAAGVYRKFAIDIWEDICGWANGTVKSSLLDASIGKLLNYSDTNINHKCPYYDYLYVKTGNLSVKGFPIANININLIPTGRYRAEAILSEKIYSEWLLATKVYFEISGR